jgi:hypothetical protein
METPDYWWGEAPFTWNYSKLTLICAL